MTISRTLGRPTITLSKALRNQAGDVLAVYYLGLNLDWLGRTLAVTQQDDLNVSLLDEHGVFIARYPDAEHWAGSTVQSAEVRRSWPPARPARWRSPIAWGSRAWSPMCPFCSPTPATSTRCC
jgi:hypothetical protein